MAVNLYSSNDCFLDPLKRKWKTEKNVWQIISMSESSRVKCGWCSCCAKLHFFTGFVIVWKRNKHNCDSYRSDTQQQCEQPLFPLSQSISHAHRCTCAFIQVTLEALFTRNNQQQKLSLSILRWTQPITDHILWNVLLATFSSVYVTLSHTMKPHPFTLSPPLPVPFCHLPGSLSQFFTYLSPFPRLERGTTGA